MHHMIMLTAHSVMLQEAECPVRASCRVESAGGAEGAPELPGPKLQFDWRIKPSRISICKRSDGRQFRLGAGAFGTVPA